MGGKPKDPEAAGQDDKGRRLVGLESSAVGTYAECYPGYVTNTRHLLSDTLVNYPVITVEPFYKGHSE